MCLWVYTGSTSHWGVWVIQRILTPKNECVRLKTWYFPLTNELNKWGFSSLMHVGTTPRTNELNPRPSQWDGMEESGVAQDQHDFLSLWIYRRDKKKNCKQYAAQNSHEFHVFAFCLIICGGDCIPPAGQVPCNRAPVAHPRWPLWANLAANAM